MNIPSNPKISPEAMEKFISGEKPPVKESKPLASDSKSGDKKVVKMYNVPFPPEVHRQAKLNAFNEGISLAEYLIRAVVAANEHYKEGSV